MTDPSTVRQQFLAAIADQLSTVLVEQAEGLKQGADDYVTTYPVREG